MAVLKLTSVGDSTGVLLPKEYLDKIRVSAGDALVVLETPKAIELSTCAPSRTCLLAAADKVLREDREVLRRLAE